MRGGFLLFATLLAAACIGDAPTATMEPTRIISESALPVAASKPVGHVTNGEDAKKSVAPLESSTGDLDVAADGESLTPGRSAPVIQQVASVPDAANTARSPRDIFRYPGEPVAPVEVAPAPPHEKPKSRFLGTIDQGRFQALFGLGGDVLALQEGDTLEGKYIIRRINPDSVLLEDVVDHSTTSMTYGSAPPSQSSPDRESDAGTVSLSFEPGEIHVEEGLQFAALVIVYPSKPLVRCEFDVSCDSTFVDVVYVRQGVSIVTRFDHRLDSGRLSITFDAGDHFDGTACKIVFAARAAGSSAIRIENVHATDDLGLDMTPSATPAVVVITPRERPSPDAGEAATNTVSGRTT